MAAKYPNRLPPIRMTEDLYNGIREFAEREERDNTAIARVWLGNMLKLKKALRDKKSNQSVDTVVKDWAKEVFKM